MNKTFHPKNGEPIPVSSLEDIKKYMGEIMNYFGPIEIQDGHVLTHKNGQFFLIGELR